VPYQLHGTRRRTFDRFFTLQPFLIFLLINFPDYLSTIKTWLDGNANQVVTLLLVNGDFSDVSMYGDAMTSTGLASYAYTPPSKLAMSEWPTLQQLIDAGTRLVMFMGTTSFSLPS
jgi:hypothetical protein